MDAKRTQKMIGRYESGLLSSLEVANDLLCELVFAPEIDTGFPSSLPSLPNEVRQEFLRILGEIREADYRWKPPLLTSSTNPLSDGTEYSARLRRVIALFDP